MKYKKILSVCALVLLVVSMIGVFKSIPSVRAVSGTTISTSDDFYAPSIEYVNGVFWAVYSNSTAFVFSSSVDGVTWSSEQIVREWDSVGGTDILWTAFSGDYLYYTYQNESIWFRRGLLNSNETVTWDSEQIVMTDSLYAIDSGVDVLAIDSLGYPWIMISDATDGHVIALKSSTNDGTWANDTGFPQTCAGAGSGGVNTLLPLTSQKMFFAYQNGTTASGIKNASTWDGSTFRDPIPISVNNESMFFGINQGDNVRLLMRKTIGTPDYVNSANYTYASNSITAPNNFYNYSTTGYAGISMDSATNYLYGFVTDTGTDLLKYRIFKTSWSTATTLLDESVDGLVSVFGLAKYSSNDSIPILYATGSGPYNVKFALFNIVDSTLISNEGFELGNLSFWNWESGYAWQLSTYRPWVGYAHSGTYFVSFLTGYWGPYFFSQKILYNVPSDAVANVSVWSMWATTDYIGVNYTDGSNTTYQLNYQSYWIQNTFTLDSGKTVDYLFSYGSGNAALALDDFEITLSPLNSSVSPSYSAYTIGDTVNFTSTSNNSIGFYSVDWHFDNGTFIGSGFNVGVLFNENGTFYLYSNTTDFYNRTGTSNLVQIDIDEDVAISISPTFTSVNVNTNTSFYSTITGGLMPYSVAWTVPGLGSVGSGENLTTSFASQGDYVLYAVVTDSIAGTATSNYVNIHVWSGNYTPWYPSTGNDFYFQSDSHTVNGETGYNIADHVGSTSAYASQDLGAVNDTVYFGFSVSKLTAKNETISIVDVTTIAYRTCEGSGYQIGYLTMPETTLLLGRNALKVDLYMKLGSGSWLPTSTFVSDNLLKKGLTASTWNFTVYTTVEEIAGDIIASLTWGNSTCASGILSMGFVEPLAQEVDLFLLSSGQVLQGLLAPYMMISGDLFYGLGILFVGGTLYLRHKKWEVILVMMLLFGGSGGIGFLIPNLAYRLVYLVTALIITFILFRLFK